MANLFTSFLLPRLQPPCTCLRIPLQASSRSPPTAFRPKSLSKTFKNVRSTPRNRSAELRLSEDVNRFSGFFRPSHQARPNVNFKLSFAQSPLASSIRSPIWRLNFSVRNYRPPQPPTYYGRAPPPSWNRPPRGRGEGIKSWLNSINPQVLLYGIIGINVAVSLLALLFSVQTEGRMAFDLWSIRYSASGDMQRPASRGSVIHLSFSSWSRTSQ